MANAQDIAPVLLTFGGLFLLGLVADLAGRKSFLPRVTLLLLAGFIIGPSMLDLLPPFTSAWFPVLTDIALSMIGFLLGQNLTRKRLQDLGKPVLAMSAGVVVLTSGLVFSVLALLGAPTIVALLLAGIATATAPAATIDVIHECDARGRFTDTLLGIVAIDDAWGLLVFSLVLAIAQALGDGGMSAAAALQFGLREIGGAILLGVVLGLPVAYLTGRIKAGEPTQAEALGVVMLSGGLAVWLEVSYILTAIVLGAVVANFARHHDRPFRAIEGIEWPFMILFFLLAGAALHLDSLLQVGAIGGAYILLRMLGRIAGAQAGGRLAGVDASTRRWIGVALMPQAGVAVGMGLLAGQRFPDLESIILPVVLGSTVIFEILGPIATRQALLHTDNAVGK